MAGVPIGGGCMLHYSLTVFQTVRTYLSLHGLKEPSFIIVIEPAIFGNKLMRGVATFSVVQQCHRMKLMSVVFMVPGLCRVCIEF